MIYINRLLTLILFIALCGTLSAQDCTVLNSILKKYDYNPKVVVVENAIKYTLFNTVTKEKLLMYLSGKKCNWCSGFL